MEFLFLASLSFGTGVYFYGVHQAKEIPSRIDKVKTLPGAHLLYHMDKPVLFYYFHLPLVEKRLANPLRL
jgi:hypothetical protein